MKRCILSVKNKRFYLYKVMPYGPSFPRYKNFIQKNPLFFTNEYTVSFVPKSCCREIKIIFTKGREAGSLARFVRTVLLS